MPDGFGNPLVGGSGALIYPSIHSPDFQAGSTGWSINADGSAEFNGVVIRGSVVLGNNVIILDDSRDAIFVYDIADNSLIASIAADAGTDSFGNAYVAGSAAYGPHGTYSQLINGDLVLNNGDTSGTPSPFEIFTNTAIGGPHSDQPYAVFLSPTQAGIPTPITSQIEMYGEDAAQARSPIIRSRQAGILSDLLWVHQGILKYGNPNALDYGEVWHDIAFASGWSNFGSGWGNVRYRRDVLGYVELSGMATHTGSIGAPSQIFTFPAGYRPDRNINLSVQTSPGTATNPATCTLQFSTDGVCNITNYAGTSPGPISFEGVRFSLSNTG